MGAQAYTDDLADGPVLNTSDQTWLATRLCEKFETASEELITFPNRGQWGYDWSGDVLSETIRRANSALPTSYAEWLIVLEAQDTPSKWTDRSGQVYSRCDWVSARRFIQQCARRNLKFHISY